MNLSAVLVDVIIIVGDVPFRTAIVFGWCVRLQCENSEKKKKIDLSVWIYSCCLKNIFCANYLVCQGIHFVLLRFWKEKCTNWSSVNRGQCWSQWGRVWLKLHFLDVSHILLIYGLFTAASLVCSDAKTFSFRPCPPAPSKWGLHNPGGICETCGSSVNWICQSAPVNSHSKKLLGHMGDFSDGTHEQTVSYAKIKTAVFIYLLLFDNKVTMNGHKYTLRE